MKRLFLFLLNLLINYVYSNKNEFPHKSTNLLFIMFDDLRPELSIYGRHHMITPNFERLAKRSVVFDNAISQISVCNPSRDSLLTGLRPDSVGSYGFQTSFRPHMIFPRQLAESGYNTAAFGKVLHLESNDRSIWNFDSWENNWYDYQSKEVEFQNSSTMPDRYKKEEDFRDYLFTSRAIQAVKTLNAQDKNWMVSVGFKLPHLALHVPYKYFDMYSDQKRYEKKVDLTDAERSFPLTSPEIAYRCCAMEGFIYQKNEGRIRSDTGFRIGDINQILPSQMHLELIKTYNAAITFLDGQLGRLLDLMDELNLWETTTIVLTADHGMHNGEKGLWEKWTLFDESTRVPLIIYHPKILEPGIHYTPPVELIDIYPTLLDLLVPSFKNLETCNHGEWCKKLQGKSLAGIVLGEKMLKIVDDYYAEMKNQPGSNLKELARLKHLRRPNDFDFSDDFAISQVWKCARKEQVKQELELRKILHSNQVKVKPPRQSHTWYSCEHQFDPNKPDEVSIMGYSLRTNEWRYTAYLHFDKAKLIPLFDQPIYDEELYDHKNEKLEDFTHRELVNLITNPDCKKTADKLREKLITFLKEEIVYNAHDIIKNYVFN